MSAIHIPYDSPPFARTPRDAAYEMADALDLRQFTFPPGAAGQYNLPPYDLSRRQHHMGYQPGSFELQYPLDDSHMFSHPHMAHPIPRRPLSPGLYASESHTAAFGEAHHWADSTFPHSVSAPAFSEAFEEFGQPSMFVNPVKVEGKDEAQAAEAPAPPPSWSMSGSLDPTTGIYQMAPEHPRVRTAQACEKCRGRKAKCSGEHPACQRCQLRGLKCEYAAERKMRGPNKVKKSRETKAHSRRTSVASITSMTSSASAGSSMSDGSPSLASSTFTMKLDINRDTPSSPPESAGSDNDSDRIDSRRQRPRRIDLAGTRLYEQMPSPHGAALGHEMISPGAAALRRQSLPSYLLEGYVRGIQGGVYEPPRGIEIVETTPRPRSNPSYPHDNFDSSLALFPTSHSENSSSGGSVPITPLGELAYPNDYPTGDYNFAPHADAHRFAPPGEYSHQPRDHGFAEPSQSVSPQVDFGAFTYLGDADATPTLDRGKGFSAFPHGA